MIQVKYLTTSPQGCLLQFFQLILLVILDLYYHMYQVWIHQKLQVNNMSGPSKDASYVPSYVSSVNPSRSPGEQQVGSLQVKRRKTLEQVKALENIIA